ncbi:MAG: C45 family peptidase [Pseudomonadota bacterium]
MAVNTQMDFNFQAFTEQAPGVKWQSHFNRLWPAYKRWFLRYGEADRPTYLESLKAIEKHLPQFIPTYEAMVDLAGGGDHAARFLSQYCPPPLFRGCSQAIYQANESIMVRSYDYSPYVFDGLLMCSKFQERQVIGMLDGMSGLLDGINSDGLAVSMSFGGREEFGEGFGIPIVLRYLLEFAGDVKEANALLKTIPIQGAYNIMMLDRDSNFETVAVSANRDPEFLGSKISTNHQSDSHWPLYEEKVQTRERFEYLTQIHQAQQHSAIDFSREFLKPPLYHNQFGKGFGTLYNAAFYPEHQSCEYFWPENSWSFSFNHFPEVEYQMTFIDPAGYPKKSQSYSEIYTTHPSPVLRF